MCIHYCLLPDFIKMTIEPASCTLRAYACTKVEETHRRDPVWRRLETWTAAESVTVSALMALLNQYRAWCSSYRLRQYNGSCRYRRGYSFFRHPGMPGSLVVLRSMAKDEPLGIAQNTNVVVDSAEYVSTIHGSMMIKTDDCVIALSLAYTLRKASSSVRASTRSFLALTRACNCISLGSAMLCVTRSCRQVQGNVHLEMIIVLQRF